MSEAIELLKSARHASDSAESWADLSNALFDQRDGLLSKAFSTREEREAFVKSPEYRKLRKLIAQSQTRTGLVEGAAPTKSGKLLVRLPKTMHAALESEAEHEGVSLNQLVLTKLALQLSSMRARRGEDPLPIVIQAFAEVRDGASEDRVVADPELDARFLARCRELGATASDYELNWKLLSARKNSHTTHLPQVKKFSFPRDVVDQYQYASEMALRYIQREQARQGREVSLDIVICDPVLATAFDGFASLLAPDFTGFQYRWAALALRKAGRYMKEALSEEVPRFRDLGRASSLDIERVPETQGLYLIQNSSDRLFVGETHNLRMRVHRHLKIAGPQMIPDWLYATSKRPTSVSVVPLPSANEGHLKALELRSIISLSPLLNYSRAA
jgi:hypothetical protein